MMLRRGELVVTDIHIGSISFSMPSHPQRRIEAFSIRRRETPDDDATLQVSSTSPRVLQIWKRTSQRHAACTLAQD